MGNEAGAEMMEDGERFVVAQALKVTANAIRDLNATIEYLAEFFADDLVALRQQRIHSFNPPAAFVGRVVAKMVEDGASVESARADLADLWPDAKALDDLPRTV